MSNTKQKPTIFSEFIEQLRAENSENFAKSTENFTAIVNKLGLLGAFAMIKTFSDNAELAITSSPYVPLSMLKIYMNGIVNICVVLERIITEQEKKLEEEVQKLEKEEMESADMAEEDESKKESDKLQSENEKIFTSLLSKFKGEKN